MAINILGKNSVKKELNEIIALGKPNKVTKDTIIDNLKTHEIDITVTLRNMVGEFELIDEFVKLKDIENKANVEKILMENRKNIMEKIVKDYTKKCIDHNVIIPDYSIDSKDINGIKVIGQVFNMVNNYYDSLYARYCDLDMNKTLPEYDKKELDTLKYEAYKKIKENTGIEGIQNNFKNSKEKNFAEYCMHTAIHYVLDFNKNVEKAAKKQIDSLEDEYGNNVSQFSVSDLEQEDINRLRIETQSVMNIRKKIPLMYGTLKDSYESRSSAERFFSYFPFINPNAKKEREAIKRIEKLMNEECRLHIDKDVLNTLNKSAVNEISKNYYQEEINYVKYVAEEKVEVKENIVIDDHIFNENENIIEPIEEKEVNKDLIANK